MITTPDGLPTLSHGAHKPGDGKACVMEYVALLAGESWTDSPACTHPVLASAAQRVNDSLADKDRHMLVPLIGRLIGTTPPEDELEAKRLSVGLALWCARRVHHLVRDQDKAVTQVAIDAAQAWMDDPTEEAAKAAKVAAAAAYANANAAYVAYVANANANANAAAAAAYAAYTAYAASANTNANANANANDAAYTAYDANAYVAYAAGVRVEMLTGLIDEYDRLTGRTKHREVTDVELRDLGERVTAGAR